MEQILKQKATQISRSIQATTGMFFKVVEHHLMLTYVGKISVSWGLKFVESWHTFQDKMVEISVVVNLY